MIQASANLQSYNRYSYVLNNPLSYTDPSGYISIGKFFKKMFRGIGKFFKGLGKFIFSRQGLGIAVGLALTVFLGPGAFGIAGLGIADVAAAAIGGAAAGAISTGTLKGAIIGAVSAAVTFEIGHALFEGISDAVERLATKAIAHGVAQGTIAEISGGDFRDGFVGAAFSYVVSEGGAW